MEIVAGDIGGTNARFVVAEIAAGAITLGPVVTLHTHDYPGLDAAWSAFARQLGRPLPEMASIAVACPIVGEVLRMTNNPWVLRPASLAAELGLRRVALVNDFGAVGHAVARLGREHLRHLAGPDRPLPDGVIAVVGPGTGLGVAHVWRDDGRTVVIESEGGHVDFAPVDAVDDAILARLRGLHGRVSAERVISGPGLAAIHDTLNPGHPWAEDDAALWQAALAGEHRAVAALDRFCLCLGAFAGDFALATGATSMVIAGGIGPRLADHLPRSGFAARFVAKGRMSPLLAGMPVKVLTHPHPGLFGAAAAFEALCAA